MTEHLYRPGDLTPETKTGNPMLNEPESHFCPSCGTRLRGGIDGQHPCPMGCPPPETPADKLVNALNSEEESSL